MSPASRPVFHGSLLAVGVLSCFAETARFAVSPEGSADFPTLQAAIDSAPPHAVVTLRPGLYRERIHFPRHRPPLVFRGEPGQGARTTIAWFLHAKLPDPAHPDDAAKTLGTFRSATVFVEADDIVFEDLTFANTAGPVAQALALRADGDRLIFRRCRFLGWQDTLLLNRGRQFFADSYIEGHVDFIFGAATAWFERCQLHALRDGYITAASTPEGRAHGFVFADCRVTAEAGVRTYLGRPWRPFAKTVFLRTELSAAVRSEGWHNWGKAEAERYTTYAEFASTGPGAEIDGRVPWSRQLTESEAAAITARAVLGGDDDWQPAAP